MNEKNEKNIDIKGYVRTLEWLDTSLNPEYSNLSWLDYFKSHYSNYSNLFNHSNYSNVLTLLDNPVDKSEKLYLLLYCENDVSKERICEISGYSEASFYNFKSREGNKIISKKLGGNNRSCYNISKEEKVKLKLRIIQALERLQNQEENKEDQKKKEEQKNATQEELLLKFKEIILNKDIISINGITPYIDMRELKEQYPFIYENIQNKPEETIQLINIALGDNGFNNPFVRLKNLSIIKVLNVENYRSKHLGKAICSEVKITSITAPRPIITNIKFECPSCGTIISVLQIKKRLKEPSRCSCGRRGGFKEICKDMVDACMLMVEDIEPQSQIPVSKNVICYAKNYLLKKGDIEKLTPGNNIRIFGNLVEVPLTTAGGQVLTNSDWALEVIDIEEFDPELNSIDFSEEQIKEFNEISSRIDLNGLDILIESYAPEVEGYIAEKKALMIQSVQRKNNPLQTKTKSHIGIIGDPGKSKTVLSKFALVTTQGSSYSSGSGSSGVGLTASVVKEDIIGWVMKPGQLPLTRELAVIDEFNLINDEDRPKLQEGMSESKISINKAGISASPTVSCGILALANPIRGVFDITQSIVKQFNIQPQQLNRFDCIFVQIDNSNEIEDEKIAKIMMKRQDKKIESEFDIKFMRKFFTYIRNLKEPVLSKESKTFLIESYKNARKITKDNPTILINPRFLEALTRFSIGHAKLRNSNKVLKKDVESAYNILASSYLNLGKLNITKTNRGEQHWTI